MGVAQRKQLWRLVMFKDIYLMWTEHLLTQAEAAEMPGVCDRTFRRWVDCHVADDATGGGIEALQVRRLMPASNRAAPVVEVMAMVD